MRTRCLLLPMLAIFSPWLATSPHGSPSIGNFAKKMVITGYTAQIAKPSSQFARLTQHLSIDRAHDGLFYLTAEVNGQAVTFLVDTGATHVVLTPADAAKVGMPTESKADHVEMETAAGSVASRWTIIDRIVIGDKRLRHVRAAVTSDRLKVSLLGANALSQFDSVHIAQDRLILN